MAGAKPRNFIFAKNVKWKTRELKYTRKEVRLQYILFRYSISVLSDVQAYLIDFTYFMYQLLIMDLNYAILSC